MLPKQLAGVGVSAADDIVAFVIAYYQGFTVYDGPTSATFADLAFPQNFRSFNFPVAINFLGRNGVTPEA